jgi:hypothetical protein
MTAPFFSLDFGKLARALISSPSPFKPISPSIIDWADMLVIQWDAFFWSRSDTNIRSQLKDAKKTFLKRLRARGSFLLAHHYWDYMDWESEEMKRDMVRCLMDLLNLVSSYEETWKTTLSQIYSRFNAFKH